MVLYVFKEREYFQEIRVGKPKPWALFRLDGISFSSLVKKIKLKTNDRRLHISITEAVRRIMMGDIFSAPVSYTGSDEISIFILYPPYGGRLEKIISTLSSMITAHVSLSLNHPAPFDCRFIYVNNVRELAGYILERQESVYRNAVRRTAHSLFPEKEKRIKGKKTWEVLEMLEERGIKIPEWALYGTLLLKTGMRGNKKVVEVEGKTFFRRRENLLKLLREAIIGALKNTFLEEYIISSFIE